MRAGVEHEPLRVVTAGSEAEDAAAVLVRGLDVLQPPGGPQLLHGAILYEFSSEGGGLLSRRLVLIAVILGALLLGAGGAGAATATFTDPQGDAVGGAADITQVIVSNDFDGNVTFALTLADRSAFTSDDFVVILLNVDRNTST